MQRISGYTLASGGGAIRASGASPRAVQPTPGNLLHRSSSLAAVLDKNPSTIRTATKEEVPS